MMQSDENETHAECEMGLRMELKPSFFLLQSLTLPRPEVADNFSAASLHVCLNHLIVYHHLIVLSMKWSSYDIYSIWHTLVYQKIIFHAAL